MIQRVGREALRRLRGGELLAVEEVAASTGASAVTVKRAFEWLRDQGANLEYVASARRWRLRDPTFALPLLDPTVEDLQAILTAAGLLATLGQSSAAERAWALFDELDVRLHGGRGRAIRRDALRVTQTVARVREPSWVLALLRAARREVVRVEYHSPWKNERSTHLLEPWEVWLHDGILYVRGYSRTRRAPRTLRLSNVVALALVAGDRPRASVPDAGVWGADDPRHGIDEDRPGTAVVRLRGPVARWVAGTAWHPRQQDTWVVNGQVLERSVPYRSCREMARKLAGFVDGIESIRPVALRREVVALARHARHLDRR